MSIWQVPQGGAGLAVAEDVLHRGAVPVRVLRRNRLVRSSHVQVRHDERVGVDRPGAGQLGFGRARWPGCRVRRRRDRGRQRLGRVQQDPADQQPGVRGPPVRAVPGDRDLALSISIASCQSSSARPSSSRHSGAIRLAPIAKLMCSSWAARASYPAK